MTHPPAAHDGDGLAGRPRSMRRFPMGSEYATALQHPELCLSDGELRTATPRLTPLGQPRAMSGNFASVFDLTSTAGRRHAVKCFTRDVADQEHRYAEISRHLATLEAERLSQPWKVGFDYQRDGILVGGERYPILKMEWADAIGLMPWIERHLDDPEAVCNLAGRFTALVGDLEAAGIGHGDLQHGNLLVAADGTFRLVDYDGMYVPALAGMEATETGHRNYQSPRRGSADFGPELDRFSAWVIQLSLVALAAEPGLWTRLHEDGAEYLLLSEEDFRQPGASHRFPVLLDHFSPDVRGLAGRLREVVTLPATAVPALPTGVPAALRPPHAATSAAYDVGAGASSALPAWMSGFLPREAVRASPDLPEGFSTRSRLELALAWLAPVLVPAAMVWFVVLAVTYRRRDEVRRGRQYRRQAREWIARNGSVRAELESAEAAHAQFELAERQRADAAARERQRVRAAQQARNAIVDLETRQQLSLVEQRLKALAEEQRIEREGTLRRVQDDHVWSRLAAATITGAGVTGVGASVVTALRREGVITAADFTAVRFMRSPGLATPSAHFILPSGRAVRVPGVSRVQAERLDGWRVERRTVALRTQPTGLTAEQERTIEAGYRYRNEQLQAVRARAHTSAATRKADLARLSAAEQARLTQDARRADAAAAAARDRLERRVSAARSAHAAADAGTRRAAADLAALRALSYRRYVRLVLTGRG